jgi:hypothetical protein
MTSQGAPEPVADAPPRARPARRRVRVATADVVVLGSLVVLAAALRFVGLAGRGGWDLDQGNDMATLQAFVSGGVIPLLGPPTSIGNVHHGALYYFLLAPAALPGGGRDPVAVTAFIAALGIVAVVVTWWLARLVGGSGAGLAAGLLAAVSATGVSASTAIWNPNPIPLFAAISIGGAMLAWRTRQPAWWLVAAGGQAVVQQLHVLGIMALPALALLLLADIRRRPGERARLARWGGLSCALIAAGYVPLAIHELTSGFSETRNAIAWATTPGPGGGPGILGRLVFVPFRVIAWPLVGLITSAPAVAVPAVVGAVAMTGWRIRAAAPAERASVAWLAAYVALAAVLLAVFVPSLGTVTPLPNDHYHAFVAPAVFAIVGLGAAALWRRDIVGRVLTVVGVGALVAWNVATQPASIAADGGWPAAREAGVRLAEDAAGAPLAFLAVPDFKPPTAYVYPYRLAGGAVGGGAVGGAVGGGAVADGAGGGRVAVLCDDLFRDVTGLACGGPAEDRALQEALGAAATSTAIEVVDRFSPAAGRSLTVYRLVPR